MAQNSESVYKLLDQLLEAYTPTAKQEYAEVQALARQAEGEDFVLMPWDWAYYSHKLKDRKFNIDDELLRPYFELNNVKQGVFGLATSVRHAEQPEQIFFLSGKLHIPQPHIQK